MRTTIFGLPVAGGVSSGRAELVLATLINRYRFTLADERPVLPVAIMTLGANRRPLFNLSAVPRQGKA